MMTAITTMTSGTPRLRLLSAPLLAWLLVVAGAVSPAASGPVLPLISISSQTEDILPAPVPEIRARTESLLAAAFTGRGGIVIAPEPTLALQRRWRVRGTLVIPQGFLDEAVAGLGVDLIVVVQVMIAPGRIFFAGRTIDPATGLLLAAGTIDPAPWSGDDWSDALAEGLVRLARRLDTPVAAARGRPLLILPVQTRGLARHDTETATHALLEAILDDGGFSVPDPAVLNAQLIAAGHDPRSLDREAMTILADARGAETMLVTEILSYGQENGRSNRIYDDSYQTAVPQSLPSLSYFARLVDLRSGLLDASALRYFDNQPRTGWFGMTSTRTSRSVLGLAARTLWDDLGYRTEASDDRQTGRTRPSLVAVRPDRPGDDDHGGRRHVVRADGPGHGQR